MILGPSYSLNTRRAAVQRSVNYMLRPIEPGNERGGFYLQQVPGLVRFSTTNAIRGMVTAGDRLFIVAGNAFCEVTNSGGVRLIGTIGSSSGTLSMAVGLRQIVMVDGPRGYIYTLPGGPLQQISDPDFEGAQAVVYVDGYFVFVRPDSQQFYISDIDAANSIDALNFASSEAYPDNLVTAIVTQRELWMMGERSVEVWTNVGDPAFPFARVSGAILEVGCVSPSGVAQIDNTVMWLGRDRNGTGMVYRAEGYRPARVSTHAVEEALRAADLSSAVCWTYQQDGQTFWCLNADGLSATWVYDISSGQWHERCELVAGDLQPARVTHHAFAFGRNLGGASDGLYTIDPTVSTIDGSPMYRERTSPHQATPSRNRLYFHEFRLDVEVGQTPQGVAPLIELQWSDDGGETWGNWLARSLGSVGQYKTRVQWPRLGAARDRVWRLRTTSNARASIVGASVRADEALG